MKSFDDFCSSYSDEMEENLQKIITGKVPDGTKLTISELVGTIVAFNRQITLDTLRLYHEWLSEQLQ